MAPGGSLLKRARTIVSVKPQVQDPAPHENTIAPGCNTSILGSFSFNVKQKQRKSRCGNSRVQYAQGYQFCNKKAC